MSTISLEDAQARLPYLIANLEFGEELIITVGPFPVARLVGANPPDRKARIPGTMKGSVVYMAPDFDAPLDDFKEYME